MRTHALAGVGKDPEKPNPVHGRQDDEMGRRAWFAENSFGSPESDTQS